MDVEILTHNIYHARFNQEEKGFICSICEKNGFNVWVFEPSEIPKHLKKRHHICRKDQSILGWTLQFNKEYLAHKSEPIKFEDVDLDAEPETNAKKGSKKKSNKKRGKSWIEIKRARK